MNIARFDDTIAACRFCFMCRHLSATANVSFRESDTVRGHTLIADTIRMHPEEIRNADFSETIYRSDLSGANRCHCDQYHPENGYDEIGLQLALRRDFVAAGNIPKVVAQLAESLQKTGDWVVSGKGEVAYLIDTATAKRTKTIAAVGKMLGQTRIPWQTIQGGEPGHRLAILGFPTEAEAQMQRFAQVVKDNGIKTLLVSDPATYYALAQQSAALICEVVPAAEFLAGLIEAGTLALHRQARSIALIESDYWKNYCHAHTTAGLLDRLHIPYTGFGYNQEESYTAGEGAVVLRDLFPALADAMAQYVANLALTNTPVVTASPATAELLEAHGMTMVTVEELLDGACS